MTITGNIKVIFDTEVFDWHQKRQFVIDYVSDPDAKYNKPQPIIFTIMDKIGTSNKCNLLNQYSVGDEVEVSFNLKSKESKTNPGKYHNILEAWRIKKTEQ